MHQTPKPDPIHKATPQSRPSRKGDHLNDQNYDEGFGALPIAGMFFGLVMINLGYMLAMDTRSSIETIIFAHHTHHSKIMIVH